MNNNITITVITVTRNAKESLKRTVESVLAQTYPNIQYIVIDGASTDGSDEYISQTISKPHLWVSEPDRGIYDAMNKGIGLATGDYCIFMNAGDVFASSTVVEEVIALGMDADVVYGDILKDGKVKTSLTPRNCHKMFFCHQAVFTRLSCLKEFPFDIRHTMSADFKQFKQLYLAGKTFHYNHHIITDFDTHGVSNVSRSKGLRDNISVIWETDNLLWKCRLLPRLYFTYLMCKLRNK